MYLGNTSFVGAFVGGEAYSRLQLGSASAKRRSIAQEADSIELDLNSITTSAMASVTAEVVSPHGQRSSQGLQQQQQQPPSQRVYGYGLRRPLSNTSIGSGRHRKETSGSSSIFEDDGECGSPNTPRRRSGSGHHPGSLKRRSLRSSNPVNYPALAALVNDMDIEQKKQQLQQPQQEQHDPLQAAQSIQSNNDSKKDLWQCVSTTAMSQTMVLATAIPKTAAAPTQTTANTKTTSGEKVEEEEEEEEVGEEKGEVDLGPATARPIDCVSRREMNMGVLLESTFRELDYDDY
ncbi:hypothetical protein BGZ73_006354 [Actinomortierella ambigua]|nr:hypothetical protein BGZ73_006354 [Actinomortierella ambigua]